MDWRQFHTVVIFNRAILLPLAASQASVSLEIHLALLALVIVATAVEIAQAVRRGRQKTDQAQRRLNLLFAQTAEPPELL